MVIVSYIASIIDEVIEGFSQVLPINLVKYRLTEACYCYGTRSIRGVKIKERGSLVKF